MQDKQLCIGELRIQAISRHKNGKISSPICAMFGTVPELTLLELGFSNAHHKLGR